MPYIHVSAEVDLNDIWNEVDEDDLIEEVQRRGYRVLQLDGTCDEIPFESVDAVMPRIEHLVTCGFHEQAKTELLEATARAIGKAIK